MAPDLIAAVRAANNELSHHDCGVCSVMPSRSAILAALERLDRARLDDPEASAPPPPQVARWAFCQKCARVWVTTIPLEDIGACAFGCGAHRGTFMPGDDAAKRQGARLDRIERAGRALRSVTEGVRDDQLWWGQLAKTQRDWDEAVKP